MEMKEVSAENFESFYELQKYDSCEIIILHIIMLYLNHFKQNAIEKVD